MSRYIDLDKYDKWNMLDDDCYENCNLSCTDCFYNECGKEDVMPTGRARLDGGEYCWQSCQATEHCNECRRLFNGEIDYYENYFSSVVRYQKIIHAKWELDDEFWWCSNCDWNQVAVKTNYCSHCGAKMDNK